jgi:hypothetical protein
MFLRRVDLHAFGNFFILFVPITLLGLKTSSGRNINMKMLCEVDLRTLSLVSLI